MEDGREKKGREEAERLGHGGMVRLATGFSQWFTNLRRHSASKRGWAEGEKRWSGRGIVDEERDMLSQRGFLNSPPSSPS